MGKERAAGVIVTARDTGRVFLLLRSVKVATPLVWGMISGGVDPHEDPIVGLKREVSEETNIDPEIIDYEFTEVIDNGDKDFYLCKGFTDSEFIPTLCDENIDWGWFNVNELPEPLYPNLKYLIKKYG